LEGLLCNTTRLQQHVFGIGIIKSFIKQEEKKFQFLKNWWRTEEYHFWLLARIPLKCTINAKKWNEEMELRS
jgi:hypothetical protein